MEMTIEKIIKTFDYIKHVGNGESEYKHCREEIALDEAVTIMRKYQKIEQIIKNYDVAWEFHHMKPTIDEIRKVVKDEEKIL